MKDKEFAELQDPNNWDDERTEVLEPVKNQRSILSVAFTRQDFALVVTAAQELGIRTSEFVREAAIARALRQHELAQLSSYSYGRGQLEVWVSRPQVTDTTTQARLDKEESAVTT
ncbi:MAG: hypothetical protein EXR50_02220 [Dehalococcoidia bacterium]|nr:hypothetical protein [Dehalococcoidia bacterium]